jgi:CubicO group peptidase (beta-lactamase class C family)
MTHRLLATTGIVAASLVLAAPAQAQCPANVTYPGAAWPDATAETAAAKPDEIHALEQFMFTLQGADSARIGIRTDSVLVIQNGQLIYEHYGRTFTASNRHDTWSVTKSVTGALVGIATQHGVSTSDSVCKYLKNLKGEACDITIENLMEMSSGLNWNEIYENESNQYSSVLAMLYGEGHKDMATFVGTHARRFVPGSTWYYSTGDAVLLASVLDAAMKPLLGDDWAWKYLFDLVGMDNVVLERDLSGHSVGGSYLFATPRDMARFGYLYLNNGCWNGQQILPAGWTQNAYTLASALQAGHARDWAEGDIYGRLWWLNTPLPILNQMKPPWPDVPTDAYSAEGHWGQFIHVIPSKNMVVVRTGDDRDTNGLDGNDPNTNMFLKLALAVGH